MLRIFSLGLITLLLAGCVPPVTTTVDEFTGHKVTRLRDNCAQDTDTISSFCIAAETIEATDTGRVVFTYLGDDWISMRKAEVRFRDEEKIYTLFNARASEILRDTDRGFAIERYVYNFSLSQAENDNSGFAQFMRASTERQERGKQNNNCIIRVFGDRFNATYSC